MQAESATIDYNSESSLKSRLLHLIARLLKRGGGFILTGLGLSR